MKHISDISTTAPESFNKKAVNKELKSLQKQLSALQNLFYAEGKYSLLIILQGMDTSGKDGTIRRVFTSVNPQGCAVNLSNPLLKKSYCTIFFGASMQTCQNEE